MTNAPNSYHFADLWESVAATVPDRTAIVAGATRRRYSELDARANRLASWFRGAGVGVGDFLALHMRNSAEHLEAALALWKLGAVPVNVNFRYTSQELVPVLADGPVAGVIHDPEFSDVVRAASRSTPSVRWTLEVGSEYESAVKASGPDDPSPRRSGDDPYVLYTGGTTGSPKGVVWRMEDAFFACIGGGDPDGSLGPVTLPAEVPERVVDAFTFLPAVPLMHAAGMWTTLRWLLAGAKVVLLPTFDPGEIWRAVEEERVNQMNIVGDAMARPLADALSAADRDVSSLRTIASGGAPLGPTAKAMFACRLPELALKDSYGSSETGVHGWAVSRPKDDRTSGFAAVDTIVIDPVTRQRVAPGSSGLVARVGRVPLRYHRDPEKSAATFFDLDGRRCALTGDVGTLRSDGTLMLQGRSSQCINSGGEKIHAEEVESVIKAHPSVLDALVVGAPDPVWGQAVVAVVQTKPGTDPAGLDIQSHCRASLAGYKVPKHVVVTHAIERSPAGKPDYRWAMELAALSRAGAGETR